MDLQFKSEEEADPVVGTIANAIRESDSAALSEIGDLAEKLRRRASKRRGLRAASRVVGTLAFVNVLIGGISLILPDLVAGQFFGLNFNLLYFGAESRSAPPEINIGGGWILLAVGLFAAYAGIRMASNDQLHDLRRLMRTGDIRLVTTLIDLLDVGTTADRQLAREELPALLSRLRAEQSPMLSDFQRDTLRWAVLAEGPELTSAILRAWEQIGTAQDIKAAEKLERGAGKAGSNSEIRKLAGECLEFLRQRADSEKQQDLLLRAAAESGSSEGNLLRPTVTPPSEEPQSLLRPSSTE